MGVALTFVTGMASIITWAVYRYILLPLHLEVLQITSFILVIAVFVQLVEMYLKKFIPSLYKGLGIYLALITTNCIVLGVALLNINRDYTFIAAAVFGIAAGIVLPVNIKVMELPGQHFLMPRCNAKILPPAVFFKLTRMRLMA